MKHKLLSLFALAGAMLASASVWAQDEPTPSKWADPIRPVKAPFEGVWVTPEAGKSYYIYNVGAAQFMGCGRDWGTRTVTTNDSIVSPTGSQVSVGTNKNFAVPFAIETVSGTEYFYIRTLNTSKGSDARVAGDGNASWSDYATGKGNLRNWQFVPVGSEENAFLLHCAAVAPYEPFIEDDPTTEEIDESANNDMEKYRLLGVCDIENGSYTWNDLHVGGFNYAGVSHKVTWKFVEASDDVAKSIRIWRDDEVYKAALAAYEAKVVLHATLDAADAAGISETDINAAVAVYESETATEAEILAANTALQLSITLQGQEPPVEITGVLQNPDFSIGNISGWETNYVSGKQATNIGYQYLAGTHDITLPDGTTDKGYDNGEVWISKFIEAWNSSGAIGDGYLQQTIYGLPAGKYRLECDAIAVRQGQTIEQKGAYLFIQAGILEEKTTMSTGDGLPEHFVVEFENDGAPAMTFGMKTESATVNWIAADNFQLFYDGALTESPHYKQLKKYLEEVELAYSADDTYCNATAKATLEAAIEAADAITRDATDAECDAAYTLLSEAYAAVLASAEVYEQLYEAVQDGGKFDEYEALTSENGWDALSQQITELKETLETAYVEGSLADDEVADAIKGVLPLIRTWVSENIAAIKPGSDLTILLENADFSEGSYGNTGAEEFDGDENSIPGWTISSGNITELRAKTGNIETFHKKFDFNQTIPNMPAGVYDITVQGFVRHDGSATDQTIFYAGDLETQLMQCNDQSSEEGIWPEASEKPALGDNNHDVANSVLGGWQCNGMTGFYYWCKEEAESAGNYAKWQPGDMYYTNHIKAYLLEPGDFKIGMKSLGTNDWIIWDNFQITYLGDAGEIYAEMAEEKLNELTAVYENDLNSTYLTAKATEDYNAIVAIDYTSINSLEGFEAYAVPCDALIKYIKEGTELGSALENLLKDYENRYTYSEAETGDFQTLHDDMLNKLEACEFADNAELEAAPAVLAKAWTECILKDAESNPMVFGNVTEIIYSPDYLTYAAEEEQTSTSNGWTWELEEGATFGNARAADRVAEVWNAGGEFKHYQKLTGLKEGYYRLTVNGWFRPSEAFSAAEHEAWSAISRAFMFGESSEGNYAKLLKNVLAYGEIEDPEIEGESTYTWTDGEEEVSVYTPSNCPSSYSFFSTIFADAEATELEGEDVDQPTYRNTLDVKVGADGVLTIGISNKGLYVEGKNNDFVVFSNWTLSYLGTEAPVGIAVVDAKTEKAPAVIYTIDGRQASRLQRGLNIVRNADGNVQKVLVK